MKKISISTERQVTLDGLMTLGKFDNGLRTMDFMCCEDAEVEPFTGHFKVQGMRDGNVYMQEHKKRVRDNSTLLRKAAHGRLSATRDEAYQLTLKVFKREGLDVRATLLREAMELIENVKL
jgi:hypothetical protein